MAKARDYTQQKKYNARPENRAKRAADNRARRRLGLKVGDPQQAGRTEGGGFRKQSAHSNMSHGGKIGNRAGKARGGRKSRRT